MVANILVVDDEPDIVDLVVKRLVRQGHRISAADSGSTALALVHRHGVPDAAILDVDMPGMDGFDLLAALRTLRPHLPALFLTVLWRADVHARVRAAGGVHVGKPFTATELATGVQRLLAPDAVRRSDAVRRGDP